MRQYHLKKIRVIIALIFFLFTTFFLLDFRKLLPEAFYDIFLYLQFIPSLLKFIYATSIVTVGFLIVLLLTALFGRIYCSAICPLGILQDIILWLKKRIKRKFRYRFTVPVNYLRYFFLVLPIIAWLAGTIVFINLLDPFSNFGRIASDLMQPVYIFLNNTGAKLLEKLNIFFLYQEEISLSNWKAYIFPLFILGLVVWMSLWQGRLYCNTVCPAGTLLGLLSRISVFRIKITESKCTKCGDCSFTCKSTCINIKELKVDFSRCVGCFNCISKCPESAIKYVISARQKSLPPETDDQRRKMIMSAGFLLLNLFGFRKSILAQEVPHNKVPTKIEPDKHFTVTPPGSLGIEHFTSICTACHLCVSACPTRVLQPSILEYGITGLMQPYMDYNTNYCNFDCVICSEICPAGAILSLTTEAKKTVQIGKVNFILENCVVYTDHTSCGSCSENCPTQAVRMVPYKGELTIPETRPNHCIGCGACEYACPTRPFKAIYVDGNEIHQTATPLKEEELKEPVVKEDFPF